MLLPDGDGAADEPAFLRLARLPVRVIDALLRAVPFPAPAHAAHVSVDDLPTPPHFVVEGLRVGQVAFGVALAIVLGDLHFVDVPVVSVLARILEGDIDGIALIVFEGDGDVLPVGGSVVLRPDVGEVFRVGAGVRNGNSLNILT